MIGASTDTVLALYEWDQKLGKLPKHKGGSHKCLLNPLSWAGCLCCFVIVFFLKFPNHNYLTHFKRLTNNSRLYFTKSGIFFSFASCDCCTCGSTIVFPSWSEVMSCPGSSSECRALQGTVDDETKNIDQ